MDVVQTLWGFCNTLRHDGINYGDYIEQLTYLLFLKLADEKGLDLPHGYDWPALRALSGTKLTDHYTDTLRELGKQPNLLGNIFAGALSRFREPVNLKKLIGMLDEIEWATLDVDLKGEAYEGLLQKFAAEQKGAGQYFTPRPLIRTVVQCLRPDIREAPDFTANDRAGAQTLGDRYDASLVIWGADTGVRVTINFFNRKQPQATAADVQIEETTRTQIANPSEYAEFITKDLPNQLTFLALFALGQSYYTQAEYEKSAQVIEKAVAKLGQEPKVEGADEAYFRLGWLYQVPLEDLEQAIADYDRAVELNPQYAKAYYTKNGHVFSFSKV